MLLSKWEELPSYMQNEEVRHYYNILQSKKTSLFFKRVIDIVLSIIIILLLIIPIIVIAISIKVSSKGKVMFKQTRITTLGKEFKILKFRTMVENAESIGEQITQINDNRITKNGEFLRKYRLDELPQIFNVFLGQMSLVGTRPEVPKYVNMYTDKMYATLLMPAGVTSLASIKFKDESEFFDENMSVDDNYMFVILPKKMEENLNYIEKFSVLYDIKLLFKTATNVLKD